MAIFTRVLLGKLDVKLIFENRRKLKKITAKKNSLKVVGLKIPDRKT